MVPNRMWNDPLVSASDAEAGRAERSAGSDVATETLLGEPGWPPVVAVLVYMVLNIAVRIWLPHEGAFHSRWVLPVIEGVLVAVLITSDPSGLAERRRLRRASLVLVGLLVAGALWVTGLLVVDLIRGTGVSNSPSQLLAEGALVWLGNNLAFALLYWLIDGGGPIARSRQPTPVDFAFPQHLSPEVAQLGLEAGLSRLPAPRLHERDRVQPHRCDAAHPPRQVRDARAVDPGARAVRPRRRASRQRVQIAAGHATPLPQ